jgi:hypothetical protein
LKSSKTLKSRAGSTQASKSRGFQRFVVKSSLIVALFCMPTVSGESDRAAMGFESTWPCWILFVYIHCKIVRIPVKKPVKTYD